MTQAKTMFALGATDAISILTSDHKLVKKMFTDFAKLMKSEDADEAKGALVDKICEELTVHAQIEEEIFYPAVRSATKANDQIDEAEEEHAVAKELIAQLQEMVPGDDQYDDFVTLLGENIDRHVNQAQDVIFPEAKKAWLDFATLGELLLERKQELQESVVATA